MLLESKKQSYVQGVGENICLLLFLESAMCGSEIFLINADSLSCIQICLLKGASYISTHFRIQSLYV